MKIWLRRWKWYLISGASVLVALLVFAVIVYINMTPTLGKDANTADKIFDFLDKWASAGGPAIMLIAIAVALAIGIMSLRQTRGIQERQFKHTLLNEIIKWAIDIVECGADIVSIGLSTRDTDTLDRALFRHINEWKFNFEQRTSRTQYMRRLNLQSEKRLKEAIEELAASFDTTLDLLGRCHADRLDEFAKQSINLIGQKLQLNDSAHKVIEEATEVLEKGSY